MKISLYLLSFSLVILSCSSKAEKETQPKQSIPVTTVEKDTSGLVIAFYFNDSLKEGFTYYKNIDEDVSRKNLAFQTELKRRTAELENFVSKKGAEAQQGLLSENEIMKIQQKAQRMEAELMEYQQKEGAKLEAEVMRKLTDINNKVISFGKIFSEANGIDLLMGYADGGQINYANPSMNVTGAFIDFLNKEQKQIEEGL